ncbi:MAG: G5 domain-containing protein [Eubacterium sp.]|nr:G5 domain-containing protein [Eubacterium sp.]
MSKLANAAKNVKLRKLFSAVISLVLLISVFTSTARADVPNQYDVKIIDAGKEVTVTTNQYNPSEILANAGIVLEDGDLVETAKFNQGVGGEITVKRLKTIKAGYENSLKHYKVYANKVGEALKEAGLKIKKGYRADCTADTAVKDGMTVKIKKTFKVSIKADGKTQKQTVIGGTVADLVKLSGIKLCKEDYTKPALTKKLKKNMKVEVFRVVYRTKTETQKIKYKTKKVKEKKWLETKKKVIKKGKNGKKEVTYKVKYVNGEEKDRDKVDEVILKKAVKKIVKVGTKKCEVKPNGVESANGIKLGQVIDGRYTHYCACSTCNGAGAGTTSSGKRIYNGMKNPYYIACNWLPLGSVIKVNGHNYTVVDRGGSGLSRKGRIDIFTPEGHSACYRYGTGNCKIEVLRLGW